MIDEILSKIQKSKEKKERKFLAFNDKLNEIVK
jgi:hypothetical protein